MFMQISTACGLAVLIVAFTGAGGARAQSDTYHITSAEKAACTADAIRLCSDAYPDEGKLLSCMMTSRASLSSRCAVAFDAGLKRRRLVSR